MDINGDGYLQEDEFNTIFVQFGAKDTSWTKETFKAMDVNGDGKLSIEEYIDGFNDFFILRMKIVQIDTSSVLSSTKFLVQRLVKSISFCFCLETSAIFTLR